jgi:uncharacterized protein (TIGR02145 family)
MKIQLNHKGMVSLPIFTATIALALAFTFNACDSGGGGDGGNDGGSNYTDKGNSISSYKTKTIGTQVWMTENLNYKVAGSLCYGEGSSSYSSSEVQSNCNKYGRLYDWATAKTVCPSGWHLPSNEDWDKLYHYADGTSGTSSPYSSSTAGKYLKATSGWDDYNGNSGNGTDAHGFSALPGGHGISGGLFGTVGYNGYWWSSSEYDSGGAYRRYMLYDYEDAGYGYGDKSSLYSVRCVKD